VANGLGRHLGETGFGGLVQGFEVGWWQVRSAAVEAPVVAPVDVFQGGDLDLVAGLPRASGFDQLGFEQPDRGLREGIRVGICGVPTDAWAPAAARRGEAFSERNRRVLGEFNWSLQQALLDRA
jgi:hypothetical protein